MDWVKPVVACSRSDCDCDTLPIMTCCGDERRAHEEVCDCVEKQGNECNAKASRSHFKASRYHHQLAMPGRLARPLNTSRLYSSLIRPPLRLSHLHTFTRKRPSPTRTHTHTPHRTTSTRLLPTLLLTTTTMSTTSDTHHVEEQEEEELTRHLMGHPLPALINLPSTSSSNSSSSDTDPTSSSSPPSVEADLFMLSLTSPILVYCFSDNSPTTSTNTHQGLANFNAVVPLLKDKERQNQQRQQQQQQQDEEEGEQGTDLVVFGLTLDSVETCENLKHEHKLNVSFLRVCVHVRVSCMLY